MKILHTSDWHLGAVLRQEKRYDEFDKFLAWFLEILKEEKIDVLLIAGDVFDTSAPSNRAAEQYYSFLAQVRDTGVKKVIVTAGNHDSASFLDAPKSVLKFLKVHTIGKANPDFHDQIIPLEENDSVCAVVCAVPFLRDRDIRQTMPGENVETLEKKRREAVIAYYKGICARAAELHPGVPQIVTGHFFATGGKVSDSLFTGNLSNISVSELPDGISYLALGHLHTPQNVGGKENYRYSGSPLKMSFGDNDAKKEILILDTGALEKTPQSISVPEFQKMAHIEGDMEQIKAKILELGTSAESIWLSVLNTGPFVGNLQAELNDLCKNTLLKVLICQNQAKNPVSAVRRSSAIRELSKVTPETVFCDYLKEKEVAEDTQVQLIAAFRQIVAELAEEDANAQ
ncbi:MAG: exonuclease subunit SbcD [Lentisphaerae bacterium]|nr:exonuclease subunit SbcD [Lentisphaerota bacterium]MBR2872178.1 exonuclease SbcCD subunit D C-terminal domain-containing protein [Lentisphaeria bacterium]